MKMELYNTTSHVKVLPKYRYNGKFSLMPHACVEIEDYMAQFFKPYSRIGVVVRAVKHYKEESDFVGTESGLTCVGKNDESIVDLLSNVFEEPAVESDTGIRECVITVETSVETVDNDSVSDVAESKRLYTEEDLQSLPLKELKDIASSMGIVIEDARRKAPIIDSILAAQ